MSNFAYYLLWLGAGLVLVAIASAIIARHLRQHVLRRLNAAILLEALERYADWVANQRRSFLFEGDDECSGSSLRQVRELSERWFPEARAQVQEILAVHARLVDFLERQQTLRLHDPEAWFESDHDARFMDLWRLHLSAVCAISEKLERVTGSENSASAHRTTFPA